MTRAISLYINEEGIHANQSEIRRKMDHETNAAEHRGEYIHMKKCLEARLIKEGLHELVGKLDTQAKIVSHCQEKGEFHGEIPLTRLPRWPAPHEREPDRTRGRRP